MKSFILASLMLVTLSAQALEVGVAVGRDAKLKKDLTTVTVGKSIGTVGADLQFSRAEGAYESYGANFGKSFRVGPVSVIPHVGASYVNMTSSSARDGYSVSTGFGVEYALSKTVALTGDLTRSFNVRNNTDFTGNAVTFGVKGSF